MTLAAFQMEKGTIVKNIRNKALDIIGSGQGLDRWEETGKDESPKVYSPMREDSTTGLGQIFANTAIDAYNFDPKTITGTLKF
jgi:hypothetical protein